MADQAQSLLQLLECHICSEIFNEADRKPKVLPCQHTFCLACMKKLGHHDFQQNGVSMVLRLVLKCPECNVEYEVPGNDVETYPNNITMIGFLSVAPLQNDLHSKPIAASQDDLKGCLVERVDRLRDEIEEAKTACAMKLSAWETEVEVAKKQIRLNCTQFKESIDRRETTLINQLEKFSTRRGEAYQKSNVSWHAQLMTMEDFCNQMEYDLKRALSDRKVTQNLDQCLGFMETLETGGEVGDETDNGAKWKFKFSPDRRDTVHASIAMYGQLNVLDPSIKAKKAAARQAEHQRSPERRRVYTRDFLLRMQPHCRFRNPPPLLTQIPEIHAADKITNVQQMLAFNKLMLEQTPMLLSLLNEQRQPISVQTIRPRGSESTTTPDGTDEFFTVNEEDMWSPPRLYLGSVPDSAHAQHHPMSSRTNRNDIGKGLGSVPDSEHPQHHPMLSRTNRNDIGKGYLWE